MIGTILKTGLTIVGSMGTTVVVEHAIKATTPELTNVITKALVKVGTVAVGAAAASMVSNYISDEVDKVTKETKEIFSKCDEDGIIYEEA